MENDVKRTFLQQLRLINIVKQVLFAQIKDFFPQKKFQYQVMLLQKQSIKWHLYQGQQ